LLTSNSIRNGILEYPNKLESFLYIFRRYIYSQLGDLPNLKGDLAAETQENIIGSIVRVYNKNNILVMTGKIKADGTYDFAVPVGVDYYFHIVRPNYTRFVYHNLSIITGLNNIDKIYLNLASIGTSTVKGLLRNADNGVISGSVVRIYNKAGYLVMTGLADALGTYDFAVPVGVDYYIRTVRTGYTDFYYYGVNVILNQIYNVENLYLSLATLGTGTLKGKLSLDSGVVSGTVVRIYNKAGRLIMTTIAGADGAYQFFVPTGVDYYLRIIRTGYTDFYYYGINVVINNIYSFSEIFKVYSSTIGVGYYSGVYLDAETQKPVANTIVRIYADDGVTVVATGLTDINGYYYITVPTGINYYYRYYTYVNNSYIYYRTYRGLTFTPNYYYYSQPYYYIAPQLQGKGTIAGSAINGLNRDRVQGLTVKLREGVNNKTEAPILTTTTGAKGFYSFQDVDAGLYTIEVSGTGYATTYYSALVYGSNVNQSEHNIIVTQKLNPGQTRVVLFWGSRPSDLDLHLTGPDTGEDRFHLSFDNKGSSTASPFATYDADFFGGYGPEVVTIHNQKPGGVYRFSVHDYTNQASTTANKSWALSYSSARVYIYNSSGYVNSFWVPYNSNGGNLWTAFELKDEVITPVNTMSYVSSGFNIQSRGSSVNDSSFIRRSSSKKR